MSAPVRSRSAQQTLELRALVGRLWKAELELHHTLRCAEERELDADLRARLVALHLELSQLAHDLDVRAPGGAEALREFWIGLLRPEDRADLDAVLRSGKVHPGRGGGRSHRRWKNKRTE